MQELRWKKGWSTKRLAKESGVSLATICRIENGKINNPTIEVAFKLADALDVPVNDLFFW